MKYTGFEEFLETKYGDLPYCRQKHFLGGIWTYLPIVMTWDSQWMYQVLSQELINYFKKIKKIGGSSINFIFFALFNKDCLRDKDFSKGPPQFQSDFLGFSKTFLSVLSILHVMEIMS